ncbi:hypothetical protein [Mesonia aquimarina]|uniref:hypothetical protein n=1 Tax=Mesonia aquimarina TaxID=1504967 RepID=UPI000EF5CAC2|nr:hypothetical protein [Mesonia aquimarina]
MKQDKNKHIAAGLVIYAIAIVLFLIVCEITTGEHWYNAWREFPVVLVPVFLAGWGKETIFDGLMQKGTPDPKDYFATIALPVLITLVLVFVFGV